MSTDHLRKARIVKDDEYYTRYEDIEAELVHYEHHLVDKIIYCNADDPFQSNFVKYFKNNFKRLKLKKLIATHYVSQFDILFNDKSHPNYYEYDGENEIIRPLDGNGSFDSKECVELIKQCDLLITNPPFSLFIPFIKNILKYNKDYLLIGSIHSTCLAVVYKEHLEGRLYLGINSPCDFERPCGEFKAIPGKWLTNLDNNRYIPPLELTKNLDEIDTFEYWNYKAINIDRLENIPKDYFGWMGVPITFLDKFNRDQFETCDSRDIMIDDLQEEYSIRLIQTIKDGHDGTDECKRRYTRIPIRRKQ